MEGENHSHQLPAVPWSAMVLEPTQIHNIQARAVVWWYIMCQPLGLIPKREDGSIPGVYTLEYSDETKLENRYNCMDTYVRM